MVKNKIITLNLTEDDQNNLTAIIHGVSMDYETSHYSDLESGINAIEDKSIFIYGYSQTHELLERDLSIIRSQDVEIAINLIFYKKDFEALSNSINYNINHVIEKDFTAEDIKRVLLKCELASKKQHDIHLKGLEYLLETPIKVKTDEQMYQYLRNYFMQILNLSFFSMLKQTTENLIIQFGDEEIDITSLKDELKNIVVPTKTIGSVFEIRSHNLFLFPIYDMDNEIVWGAVHSEQDREKIFNDIFFKYLENVHLYRKIKDKVKDLKELANTDEITGLFNQRKLTSDLSRVIQTHKDLNKQFSIMFIDVDHFKNVNDNYGHLVGSQMLIQIGDVLKSLLRDSDHIYRFGGDEFVVLMEDSQTEIVHKVASRILKSVKEMDFLLKSGDIYKLSISIGIAEYPKDARTAKEVLQIADEMMYESKKAGRGKVFHLGGVIE